MAAIGNSPTQQAFTPAIDYFSGNGSTTAFTLSRPVASVAQVQVTIDNVAQNPSSAYTVSSNTITFTSAPLSGTNNIYVYYTSPITQVIAPGQGTVTATSMASSTGTGAGVFQTSPTINTPTLASANITTALTLTGASGTNGQFLTSAGSGSAPTWTTAAASQWTTTGSNIYYTTGNICVGGTTNINADVTVQTGGRYNIEIQADASLPYIQAYDRTGGAFMDFALLANTLSFRTGGSERIRIADNGQLGFAGNTNGNFGSQSSFYNPSSSSWCAEFNTGVNGNIVMFQRTTSYPCTQIQFYGFNGAVATNAGSITHSGSTSTSYNTSSDYRMKENVQPMTSALSKVVLLKPVTYKWKEEFGGKDGQGFIAHELQEVFPEAVVWEKDAVDEKGDPKYQGVDTSYLVATLTAAIQELKAINDTQAATITALTARITALENK